MHEVQEIATEHLANITLIQYTHKHSHLGSLSQAPCNIRQCNEAQNPQASGAGKDRATDRKQTGTE